MRVLVCVRFFEVEDFRQGRGILGALVANVRLARLTSSMLVWFTGLVGSGFVSLRTPAEPYRCSIMVRI